MNSTPPPAVLRCRAFAFGSDVYRQSVALREEVLRRPLGLTWEAGAFDGEAESFHLGCFARDELVGTLILRPLDAATVKMRQVAVSPAWQGRGVGRLLVRFSERFAAERGYTAMTAHAREAVLGFYRKLGYRAEGDVFVEVGIPHRHIRKDLGVASSARRPAATPLDQLRGRHRKLWAGTDADEFVRRLREDW